MPTLIEQRDAALKDAGDIVAGAKAAARDLTTEENTLIKGKLDEVDSLNGKISQAKDSADLIARLGAMPGDGAEEGAPASASKSLGEFFVKHLQKNSLSLKTRGTIEAPEFKAATDTQSVGTNGGAFGPLVTDIDPTFVLPYRRPLVVADLLAAGTVSGNAITYPVFGALEGGSAFIAEGGAKPQMHVADPTWVTDSLGEVAGWFKITDDMAEDIPYVQSEINTTAIYDLQLKEEAAILTGNGTAPNIKGLLNRSGIQTLGQGTDTNPDRIFTAISNVQTVTGFAADGIIINPTDYAAIRLSKDSNDQYYGGGFFTGQYGNGGIQQQPPLWGLPTVVTSAVAAGTVVVGAFKVAGKVFRKGGLRVESTNSHVDDFTNDKITIRLRERLGLQVKYPAAIVKVTLGLAG